MLHDKSILKVAQHALVVSSTLMAGYNIQRKPLACTFCASVTLVSHNPHIAIQLVDAHLTARLMYIWQGQLEKKASLT